MQLSCSASRLAHEDIMMGFVQGEPVWAFCPGGFFARGCSGQWWFPK